MALATANKMSYCAELVARYDRDRYRLSLTVPRGMREDLWALFAFNHEIAKTREVVSEPTLGLIRLQWWREALDKLYGGEVPAHEILVALSKALSLGRGLGEGKGKASFDVLPSPRPSPGGEGVLPRPWFDALIDARERDLDKQPFATLAEVEDYADATATPLYRLALGILGQGAEEKDLRSISTAYALTGLLRAQPFDVANNKNRMPHGLTSRQMAERAAALLAGARPQAGFLKASASLTRVYLRRLEKSGYDLEDSRLHAPVTGFSLQALLGRFR
jgi:NADH dehydrogenase [ubiquinone] 1 alpha subcomplex assembly factor 6